MSCSHSTFYRPLPSTCSILCSPLNTPFRPSTNHQASQPPLQDSVGGNSRTTLIVCGSPSASNEGETLSTLRFGERAKNIKNNAKINRDWTVAELKVMLAKANRENALLRKAGGAVPPEENSGGIPDDVAVGNEWEEERCRLLKEKEALLQQMADLNDQLQEVMQNEQRLKIENEGLRRIDETWEEEYYVLQRRLADATSVRVRA